MPSPFAILQRPTLPTISSWTISPRSADVDEPNSAPPRLSSTLPLQMVRNRLSSSKSIASLPRKSLTVSHPGTPHALYPQSPSSSTFGLPTIDDDDPFGVRALEQAGLHIKEAGTGTNHRPSSGAFSYRPGPNSPIWRTSFMSMGSSSRGAGSNGHRPSVDSRMSMRTGTGTGHSRHSSMSDAGTQTSGIASTPALSESVFTGQVEVMSPSGELTGPAEPLSPFTNAPDHGKRVTDSVVWRRRKEADGKREESMSPKAPVEPTMEHELDCIGDELEKLEREWQRSMSEDEEPSKLGKVQPRSEDRASNGSAYVTKNLNLTPNKSPNLSINPATANAGALIPAVLHNSQFSPVPNSQRSAEPVGDDGIDDNVSDASFESFDDDEEPIIIGEAVSATVGIASAQFIPPATPISRRAQVVSIHLPPPPPLPRRNSRRRKAASSQMPPAAEETVEHERTELRDSITSTAAEEMSSTLYLSPRESLRPGWADIEHENDSSSSFSGREERDSVDGASGTTMTETSLDEEVIGDEVADEQDSTPTRSKAGVEALASSRSEHHAQDKTTTAEVALSEVTLETRRPFSFEVQGDEWDDQSIEEVVAACKASATSERKVKNKDDDDASVYSIEDFS